MIVMPGASPATFLIALGTPTQSVAENTFAAVLSSLRPDLGPPGSAQATLALVAGGGTAKPQDADDHTAETRPAASTAQAEVTAPVAAPQPLRGLALIPQPHRAKMMLPEDAGATAPISSPATPGSQSNIGEGPIVLQHVAAMTPLAGAGAKAPVAEPAVAMPQPNCGRTSILLQYLDELRFSANAGAKAPVPAALAAALQPDITLPPNDEFRPIPQQAFAFSQLGVLGLAGPTAGAELTGPPAIVAAPGRAAPLTSATPPRRAAAPSGFTDAAQASAISPTGPSAGRLVSFPAALEEMAVENAPAKAPTTPSRMLTANIQDTDEVASAEPTAVAGPGRELPAIALAAPTVSVIVSPDGGAVQVVASAPDISAEARNRLIEAVLRAGDEFGISLSDLRVNGVSIRVRSGAEQGRLR
jgi:hypothetical protein